MRKIRRYNRLAEGMLDRLEQLLEAGPDVKDLRAMASILKDLKDVQGACTDLEQREWEAKIESLRRRAESGPDTLTVEMEEALDGFCN